MAAAFAPGQRVRVRADNPRGHTRAPAYVRGRRGVVESVRPAAKLPDAAVRDPRTAPREPVYAVHFEMPELWGAAAEPSCELLMELWESYLEPDEDAPPT